MVGIPAYNEENAIADVVAQAAPHVDEILVVDDGSEDETPDRAWRAGATVAVHERNRGYGAALQTIFHHAREADVEHLVVLDGDGQHDAEDIPRLVEAQRETGAEVVVGSRFVDGSDSEIPLYRYFGLVVVNTLMNLGARLQHSPLGVADTQSGFRTYQRNAIETIAEDDDIGYGMDASLGLLFHAVERGYDVEEVPTDIDYDIEEANTLNPVTHGLTLVRRIVMETVPSWMLRTGGAVIVGALTLAAAVGALRLLEEPVLWIVTLVLLGIIGTVGVAVSNTSRWFSSSADQ